MAEARAYWAAMPKGKIRPQPHAHGLVVFRDMSVEGMTEMVFGIMLLILIMQNDSTSRILYKPSILFNSEC